MLTKTSRLLLTLSCFWTTTTNDDSTLTLGQHNGAFPLCHSHVISLYSARVGQGKLITYNRELFVLYRVTGNSLISSASQVYTHGQEESFDLSHITVSKSNTRKKLLTHKQHSLTTNTSQKHSQTNREKYRH